VSLRAETIKDESVAKTFFDRTPKVPQHVIDARHVHSSVLARDTLGA
jgi:hypothetical protein